MTVLLGVYFWVRFWLLSVGTPASIERSSASCCACSTRPRFSSDSVRIRWSSTPTTSATSFLSVLFSEPDGGVFEAVRAWMTGDVPPRDVSRGRVSSLLAPALIAWAVCARAFAAGCASMRDEVELSCSRCPRRWCIANSAMSYVYTKHEILSVAGCFYAVAAFVAGRHALERLRQGAPAAVRVAIVLVLASTATLWAFRSVGVHHMLRVEAFKVRNDWARLPAEIETTGAATRPAAALIRQLRHDAVNMPVQQPVTWCRAGSTDGGANSGQARAHGAGDARLSRDGRADRPGWCSTPFDRHPIWARAELNLSEAAAVRDFGEIVRLIESIRRSRRGPRGPSRLSGREQAVRATPLEAAVASKDVEIGAHSPGERRGDGPRTSGITSDARRRRRDDANSSIVAVRRGVAVFDCDPSIRLSPRSAPVNLSSVSFSVRRARSPSFS